MVGIAKQTSGLLKTKPVGKTIQGFARNRAKDPMKMKFREAGHFVQLLQLHLPMQIPAEGIDDPINSLNVLAAGLDLLVWYGNRVVEVSQSPLCCHLPRSTTR